MLAVLQEMLLLPNTPLSLIGQLVQKLVGVLHDDQQRITVVRVCVHHSKLLIHEIETSILPFEIAVEK